MQAAVSWPYGHCCRWPRRLSRGQAICLSRRAQGEAFIPPPRESLDSQTGKPLVPWIACFSFFCSFIMSFIQVDIVDFNGSFLTRVRDFAGANPIILVITKVLVLSPRLPFFFLSGFGYHFCSVASQSTKATSFVG